LALQHGLISEPIFVALLLAAIATSVLAGPLIQAMAPTLKRSLKASEEH
jgi:hypothetical protein